MVVHAERSVSEHHSGPLPDPSTLAAYERMHPGTAERIIQMAERQQSHRMQLESDQLTSDAKHRDELVALQRLTTRGTLISDYIGQAAGFLVAAACVAASVYCGVVLKDPILAAIFVGIPVIGMIKAVRGMTSDSK